MEPRINHLQPGWLGAWLQDRCHHGFDALVAECPCPRMYYRFNGILMLTPNYCHSVAIYDNALGEAVFAPVPGWPGPGQCGSSVRS